MAIRKRFKTAEDRAEELALIEEVRAIYRLNKERPRALAAMQQRWKLFEGRCDAAGYKASEYFARNVHTAEPWFIGRR